MIPGGNNRIIIGTDGDFNIGQSSTEELITMIEQKREAGIFLTVLGVGGSHYRDYMLEQIANKGNGTMEYIDNIDQLRKVFIYDYDKFYTVAKDVKVQVKFNPNNVASYRLVGYENRILETEDFEDDTKDAGEIGAGQNITALYEIVPTASARKDQPSFNIDFRYKRPDAIVSQPLKLSIYDEGNSFAQASGNQQFTAGVAAYSLLLRNSNYKGTATYESVREWIAGAEISDKHGFKQELWELVTASMAK